MKEFMLFIRSEVQDKENLSPEQLQKHVENIGKYIKELVDEGKMKSAQPLESEGRVLSSQNGKVVDGPFIETKEVISGYYHLVAKDLEEAIAIAKKDPRFDEGIWTVEIRPIKTVQGIN